LPNSASSGSTSLTRPSVSVKPPGSFIHEFTDSTNSDPVSPASTIGMPLAKCARGDNRFQP
jgi:hypothetical protein